MTHKFTEDQVERQVLDTYYEVAGKVVLASEVVCIDEDRREVTVMCDPPAVLRIERGDLRETVLRWTVSHMMEPIYNIAVLEPHRAFDFVRPSHVVGAVVSKKVGELRPARFEVASPEMQERYRNARGLDNEEIGDCGPPRVPTP